jgi:hypothetical protein
METMGRTFSPSARGRLRSEMSLPSPLRDMWVAGPRCAAGGPGSFLRAATVVPCRSWDDIDAGLQTCSGWHVLRSISALRHVVDLNLFQLDTTLSAMVASHVALLQGCFGKALGRQQRSSHPLLPSWACSLAYSRNSAVLQGGQMCVCARVRVA